MERPDGALGEDLDHAVQLHSWVHVDKSCGQIPAPAHLSTSKAHASRYGCGFGWMRLEVKGADEVHTEKVKSVGPNKCISRG